MFGIRKKAKDNIPANLEECFEFLNRMFGEEQVEEFKSWGEKEAMGKLHFGLGRNLRNNWGLWAESKLQQHFKDMGVWHADDMSSIILTSYHRHLNNKPLDVEGQVEFFKDYWSKDKK